MVLMHEVKVTEGMMYEAVKRAIKEYMTPYTTHDYKEQTGSLRASTAYRILRNGIDVSEEKVKEYWDKPIEETKAKYSALIQVGFDSTIIKIN